MTITNRSKKLGALATLGIAAVALTGCSSDAKRASDNLSTDADQFRIERSIIFYNGITNEIMTEINGFCSIQPDVSEGQIEVTCKNGENEYTKDYLGLSDNVTYMVLQTEATDVSVYHRKIIIKPENLLPEFTIETGRQ